MNEDHIISAILTAGLVSAGGASQVTPKDVIEIYQSVLAEYLAATRPPRPAREGSTAPASA